VAQDKIPPAGLHPQLVKKLLDNLESNDAFRQHLQQSPEQALRSLGYTDASACMQLKPGETLASAEQIKAQRSKLEAAATAIQSADCIFASQQIG